jgi:predicted ATPase
LKPSRARQRTEAGVLSLSKPRETWYAARMIDLTSDLFIRDVSVLQDRIEDPSTYPYTIPSIRALDRLKLARVTYFIGENGSGKSTLLEAIAVASGFNAEGGSRNFNFATRRSESHLCNSIRLARGVVRPKTGYFLRAESFFNVASEIERLDNEPSFEAPIIGSYGNRSLHEQSHGESFLALLKHRFGPNGLYILDEPEAALSPSRQLALLVRIDELVRARSQFIIATHAPIVLAYPDALIYSLDANGIRPVDYDETEHVNLTRDFLNNRTAYMRRILDDGK